MTLYQLSAGYGRVSLGVAGVWHDTGSQGLPGDNRATKGGLCDGFDAVYVGDYLIPSVYSSHYPFADWVEEVLPGIYPVWAMAPSSAAIIALHAVGDANDGSYSYKTALVPEWTLGSIGDGYYFTTVPNSGFLFAEGRFRGICNNSGFAGWFSVYSIAFDTHPELGWFKNTMIFDVDPSTSHPAYFTALGFVNGNGEDQAKYVAGHGDGSLYTSPDFVHWARTLPPGSFGANPANCFYIIGDGKGNVLASGGMTLSDPTVDRVMFRSRNFGNAWENISANLPPLGGAGKGFEILAYSEETGKFYNGTYSTLDCGDSWQLEKLTSNTSYQRFDGLLNQMGPPRPPAQMAPRGVGHYSYTDPRSLTDTDKPK